MQSWAFSAGLLYVSTEYTSFKIKFCSGFYMCREHIRSLSDCVIKINPNIFGVKISMLFLGLFMASKAYGEPLIRLLGKNVALRAREQSVFSGD